MRDGQLKTDKYTSSLMQLQVAVALVVIVGLLAYGAYYRRARKLALDDVTIRLTLEAAVSACLVAAFLDVPSIQAVLFILSHNHPTMAYYDAGGRIVAGDMPGNDLANVIISNVLGALTLTVGVSVVYWKAIGRKET